MSAPSVIYLRARAEALGEDFWFGPLSGTELARQGRQKIEDGFPPGLVQVSMENDLPSGVTDVRPTDDAFFDEAHFLSALVGATAQMIARQRSGDPMAFYNDPLGAKASVYGTHVGTLMPSYGAPVVAADEAAGDADESGAGESGAEVNWRAMFLKYATHVSESEGVAFLSHFWDPEIPFTPAERAALEQARTEA